MFGTYNSRKLLYIPFDIDIKTRELNLNNNKITKIENLDKLKLYGLSFQHNNITKMENLNMLTSLTFLSISNNKITKIENLDGLVNLRSLYLHDNKITKIENLDDLICLEELYLENNNITKIENLSKLPKLHILSINDNPIKAPITSLKKYREYVKNIKISYELEWCDYYIIIAIINEKYIDIYRMYMYFVEKIDYILK